MPERLATRNLDKLRQTMMTCTYCGFCKSVCPTFEAVGWDGSVARGRIMLAYGLAQGDLPADESVAEYIFQCTTCKDCERRCPSGIEVVDVVEGCRRDLVAADRMLPQHRRVRESVRKHGNPYGEERSVAEALSTEKKKARLGYFAGCTAAYRNPAIAKAAMSVLSKLDEDCTLVDELCCGSVLQRIGCPEDEVAKIMRRNVDSIAAQGVDEVVFSCAGCYRMFKEEYPKHVKVPFKVTHMSELLAAKKPRLAALDKKITYHDPCHLGRHSKVYEAPREVLRSVPHAKYQEMPRSRELAGCCGGGGGVRSAYPELSRKIAARRVDDAKPADILVTTCPFCVANLRAGKEEAGAEIEILDLVELVDRLVQEG
ncbi:MAG TPA: (Fe-S)-binding protein [Methanomassiliicoccales archaeon]|nr:(Fe-S)-binding protein [Methanomassiliicoccales archaeon]